MHKIRKLSNGIRVVSEEIPYVRSISIGVWIGVGSRFESEYENGMSHYIEHMLFKGTENRSAKQIAYEIDAIGGQINAFTTREYTCYYTKTLDEHTEIALDVLSDMIFSSTLSKENMDLERNVIIEEIKMYEDEPEELVSDLMYHACYGNTPMGRTILGTKNSLASINTDNMRDFIVNHYTSANTVISISGNFDDTLFEQLEKYFGARKLQKNKIELCECNFMPGNVIIREKDIEQVQLIAAYESIDVRDDRVYSLLTFNNIFGGGMSSRLFQNIREKRGLAYSIYAYHASYINTGFFGISAGMAPENVDEVCELIKSEIDRIKRDRLTDSELNKAKEQLKGNYILSYESIGARMQAAGRNLLLDKESISSEEVIKKINAVSHESVAEVIDLIFNREKMSIAAVGPVKNINM